MKKILCVFLCVGLLTSCTGKKSTDSKKYYFVFANPLKNHPVWQQAEQGFLEACDVYDIYCDSLGPANISVDSMVSVIDTAAVQKADAIVTQGVIPKHIIDSMYDKNIPMILVDSDEPDSKRFAYFGKDFQKQAQMLRENIEAKYKDNRKLNVAVQVAERSFKIATDQIMALEEAFKDYPGGYDIVSISESKSDRFRASQEWKNVVNEHRDINVAINFAGESARECSAVMEELGMREQVLIYGVDDMEDTLQLIRDGNIDGSVVISFYNYGYQSVKLLYEYKESGNIETTDHLDLPMLIVTKENIDTYKNKLNKK